MMRRIYLDACILIYFIEKHPRYYPAIAERLESLPDYQLAVSPLLRMEVLVKPKREQNEPLIKRYEHFMEQQIMLPMPEVIYHHALMLRVNHAIKTPDALHLAIAEYHGCTEFWTNDDRLNIAADKLAFNILK